MASTAHRDLRRSGRPRPARRALSSCGAAVLLAACTPEQLGQGFEPDPGVNYLLQSTASWRCLRPAGGTANAAAEIESAACEVARAQQFQFIPDGAAFAVRNLGSGLCLDATGGRAGTAVRQSPCGQVAGQRYVAEASGERTRLVPQGSDLVLGLAPGTPGERLELLTPTGGDREEFTLIPVGSGSGGSSGGSSGSGSSGGSSSGGSSGSGSGGGSSSGSSGSGSSGASSSGGGSGSGSSGGSSSGGSGGSGSSGGSSSGGGSGSGSSGGSSSGASSGGCTGSSSSGGWSDPANLPVPPQGFDAKNGSIPHGTVNVSVSYPTRSYGQRKATIYLPPGYSTSQKYPVLYLHHGIGGNEVSWIGQGSNEGNADNVMDYLYSKQLARPMIVVMPDGNVRNASDGFGAHEDVLLNDLIPWVEKTYSAEASADGRAIAGLSMGGGQTFNFGFPHTDVFHYIGPFSAAPNTKPPSQTIKDVAKVKQDVKFIFIACGSADGLIGNSKNYHDFLNQNGIANMYQVEANQGHNKTVWNRSLYNFAQRIFTGSCP